MAEPTPFVVIAADRTGSNLLLGMLNSHPDIVAGNELFNPVAIEERTVSWPMSRTDEATLVGLRDRDPVGFINHLYGEASQAGRKAMGFKLLYGQARRFPGVVEFLLDRPGLKVIHLTRSNLLRRYLSSQRARASGVWAVHRKDEVPRLPQIEIDPFELIRDFHNVEADQALCERTFGGHNLMRMTYEELAADPHAKAVEVCRFLGVEPVDDLSVRFKKTGGDPLRSAIRNYDELVATLSRWRSFLDE